jgi:hypothetical protein
LRPNGKAVLICPRAEAIAVRGGHYRESRRGAGWRGSPPCRASSQLPTYILAWRVSTNSSREDDRPGHKRRPDRLAIIVLVNFHYPIWNYSFILLMRVLVILTGFLSLCCLFAANFSFSINIFLSRLRILCFLFPSADPIHLTRA